MHDGHASASGELSADPEEANSWESDPGVLISLAGWSLCGTENGPDSSASSRVQMTTSVTFLEFVLKISDLLEYGCCLFVLQINMNQFLSVAVFPWVETLALHWCVCLQPHTPPPPAPHTLTTPECEGASQLRAAAASAAGRCSDRPSISSIWFQDKRIQKSTFLLLYFLIAQIHIKKSRKQVSKFISHKINSLFTPHSYAHIFTR